MNVKCDDDDFSCASTDCFVPRKDDINDKSLAEELLKKGLAWHYKYYSKSELLAALEITAKENKVGLWKDENAIAPWEFRISK